MREPGQPGATFARLGGWIEATGSIGSTRLIASMGPVRAVETVGIDEAGRVTEVDEGVRRTYG